MICGSVYLMIYDFVIFWFLYPIMLSSGFYIGVIFYIRFYLSWGVFKAITNGFIAAHH